MTINTIEDYLKMVTSMMSHNKPNKFKYSCFEDFILKHGQRFTKVGKMPRGFKRGMAKQCYMNAAKLTLDLPSLIYCEGYAAGIIPVLHGWCITRRGTVIDPTWDDGKDYFGIPIKHSYLMNSMIRHKVYGVIDVPRFPILDEEPDKFKEVI